jgi:hypothetical protein
MIVEERDYRVRAGKLKQFYEQCGLAIQKEYLGTFHGYFTTDSAN